MLTITEVYNPFTGRLDMVGIESEAGPEKTLVRNSVEPANSTAIPNPENANYYEGDDYVYFLVNGQWKRTAISLF